MIRTTIIADTENISIHLPQNYLGKTLEVLLYSVDELTEEKTATNIVNNASFRGTLNLTEAQYLDFQQHAKDIRKEWNQDI